MKLAAILVAVSAALVATTQAASIVPPQHQERFLQSQTELAQEILAWKNSTAGLYAKDHGFLPNIIDSESTTNGVSNEELQRFFVTKLNIAKVQAKNPHATFSTNTPFALLTSEEFAAYVNKGFRPDAALKAAGKPMELPTATASEVDWTTSGCVAPVKDQGQCGDCWAFSAVGALESGWCLKNNKKLTLLSEQQVTSCDSAGQDQGCNGGYQSGAFDWVKSNGICTGASYPFKSGTSGSTGTCKKSCTKSAVKVTGYTSVPTTDAGLAAALNVQPVSVTIAASGNAFQSYTSGVLSACDTTELDHAVLGVGYGVDASSNVPFFKIKNSWGSSWGEAGYIRVKRGSKVNTCGVLSDNVYPNF